MFNAKPNNKEISNCSLPLSDTAWGSVPFWTWTVIFAGLEAAGSHLYSPACLWVTLCMTRLDIKRPRESVGHVDDIDLLEYAGGRAWSGAGPSCKMIWKCENMENQYITVDHSKLRDTIYYLYPIRHKLYPIRMTPDDEIWLFWTCRYNTRHIKSWASVYYDLWSSHNPGDWLCEIKSKILIWIFCVNHIIFNSLL